MRRLRMFLLPAALALGLLATACGGSSGEGASGVASAGDGKAKSADRKNGKKTDPQQTALDFARCMREHGVDVPDPKASDNGMVLVGPAPGPGGLGQAAEPPAGFEEADKACRHLMKDLISDGGGATVDAKEQDRALRFARCMRENGVNMPDPDFSKGGVSMKIDEGFNPSSEAFQAAQKACGSLFGPGGGPGVAPRPGAGS